MTDTRDDEGRGEHVGPSVESGVASFGRQYRRSSIVVRRREYIKAGTSWRGDSRPSWWISEIALVGGAPVDAWVGKVGCGLEVQFRKSRPVKKAAFSGSARAPWGHVAVAG